MFKTTLIVLSLAMLATSAHAGDGIVSHPSTHAVKSSLDKLEAIARDNGMTIFIRIDHAAGAKSVGQTLRPTEVLIFGNPKGGTPLMQCAQGFGVDLPLRVLAWEDQAGKVWLGYRDFATLGHAYTEADCELAVKRISGKLDEMVKAAAQ